MTLDLTSLVQSISVLRRSADDFRLNSANFSPLQQETFRAGIIQNFEIAYEQCWKTMKRWIEENVSPDVLLGAPRIEMFRRAAENCLIDNVETWMRFHQARNSTSHIYSADAASEVYHTAVQFIDAAENFLQNMTERNA